MARREAGRLVTVPRPSPQTTRVVDTINLLTADADGDGDGLTLTEIARELPANVSSCVHLLAALTAAGWVVRQPDTKRYRVGPALVVPGRLAAQRHPLLVIVRDEMVGLAEQVRLPVLAFRRDGSGGSDHDLARLVAITWPRGTAPPSVRIGDTVPIVAPLGSLFTAWLSEVEIQQWLSTVGEPAHRERLAQDLAVIRSTGYSVERDVQAAPTEHLEALVDDRPSPYRDRLLHGVLVGGAGDSRVLTDLARDQDEQHAVHGISAPVRVGGQVDVGLFVAGFTEPLRVDEIVAIGEVVRAAADRATDRLCTLQNLGIGDPGDDDR